MWTPWGMSDGQHTYAPGIIFYSTPGHGGIHLDEEHNNKMPSKLRNADGWYEEDCEWAKVAIIFPEAFEPSAVLSAKETMKNWLPHEYEAVIGIKVNPGESRALREEIWKEAHKDHLQVYVAEGQWIGHNTVPEKMVGVTACKGGTDNHGRPLGTIRYFLVPETEYYKRGEFSFVIEDEKKYEEVGSDFIRRTETAQSERS
jgi:hypothetical protein